MSAPFTLCAKIGTERLLVTGLCLAAALRVFVYAAAFPFFSNGDEDLHFDLVTQYSAGQPPRVFDVLQDSSLRFISLYCSPEFLRGPEDFPDGKIPTPLWKLSSAEAAPVIAATREGWQSEVNWESSQPPLYYVLAGWWWKLGRFVGLGGIESLYWIRLLNCLLIFILVWLGYVTARAIAPDQPGLRLGVPILLAFIPQDVFYVISNDVLSPVCFGVVFLCVLRWLSADPPSFTLGAITGVAIAATYLTKLSNLPLLTVAGIVLIARTLAIVRRQPTAAVLAFAALLLCGGIPVVSWMMWSRSHFIDITGSTTTIALLGWTRKPLKEWWQHPVFSLRGLWIFWSELTSRLWRGELMWHGREFSSWTADSFYAIASLLFPGVAMFELRREAGLSTWQRKALLLVQFDFGRCIYPSRDHPFFTSGRLIGGALIPFALLFTRGVVCLLPGGSNSFRPLAVIAGIAMFAATSEIFMKHNVFASEHNWYHLRR